MGSELREALRRRGIHSHFANPPHKAGLAERAVGNLKLRMARLRLGLGGRHPFPSILKTATDQINASKNAAIGMPPNQVNLDNSSRVFRRLYGSKLSQPPFLRNLIPVGSSVRIKLASRGTFNHIGTIRNSREKYVVGRLLLSLFGMRYKLYARDGGSLVPISGTWAAHELIRVPGD